MSTSNPNERPKMGAQLKAPDGALVTVVARWRGGVVFNNETAATLGELREYKQIEGLKL